MKDSKKRIICILLSLCVCLALIPCLYSAAANGEEPELSPMCETVIELSGKDTSFGANPSDLRINTRVKFDSAKDLSNVDEIEASVYVEDPDALAAYVGDSNKFTLSFSSNSRREAQNRSYADISGQIENVGWNTVTVKRADFSDGADWNAVYYVYLGFADENAGYPADLANKAVKYKNVCDILLLPKMPDADIVIYDKAVINSLGESESSLVSAAGDRFSDTFAAKDISKADIIEADFYFSDYAAFYVFNQQNRLKLSLLSENGAAYTEDIDDFIPHTSPGWYTARFAAPSMKTEGNFEAVAVTGVKLGFTGEKGAVLGDAYAIRIAVADIRGFNCKTPSADERFGGTVSDYSGIRAAVAAGSDYSSFDAFASGNFAAIGGAEYIEFDLYVKNAESFKNAFSFDGENNPIDASLDLVLRSGENTLTFGGINRQVLANGWNHIILPVSGAQSAGFAAESGFTDIGFTVSGVDKAASNPIRGDELVADNFAATKDMGAAENPKFDKIAGLSGGKSGELAGSFGASALSETVGADISGAKYIELDVYIQNFAASKAEMAKKNISDVELRLVSSGGSIETGLFNLLSKNGWNHLAISCAKLAESTDGAFDAAAVTGWSLCFDGTASAAVGALEGQKIAVANIICCGVSNPKPVDGALAVISNECKSGVYGADYGDTAQTSVITLQPPVDATAGSRIEFDFYAENLEAFGKMLTASGNPLYFALGTSSDASENLALYRFTDAVTDEGWNHIEINAGVFTSMSGDPDLKTVYYAFLTFGGQTGANAYGELPYKIMNICVTASAIDNKPAPPDKYAAEISLDGVTSTWGRQYNWTMDRLSINLKENPLDLEDFSRFEFDIYIEDYDAFKSAVAGKRINFALANSDVKTKTRIRFDFENQIKGSGWNHVILEKSSRWTVDTGFDYRAVKWVMIFFQDGGSGANPIGDTVVRIANIVGNFADYYYNPPLPDNVLAQLGNPEDGTDSRGNNVGAYFHYTLDKIYRERLNPVDFSQTNIVEFDIYISDYDKFLAAEDDPTDGQNSKLNFTVSSTIPALWDQYNSPRVYYSSGIDIAPYVSHSGWNHVKVGRSEFVTFHHGVNWSAITAYMIYYRNSSNYYPYENENSSLYVKVANIVNTGVVAVIPANSDAEKNPDKTAVYISSVDGLSDVNGAWNILNPIISTKYKTTGTASIQKRVNYNSALEEAVISYIFDTTADMSDLKTLKFDFFVDLPQYLSKPTNNIEICLANDRFLKDNYYSWNMDLMNLNQGWSGVSLERKAARAVGNPDLSAVKAVVIRFTKLDLDIANYEEIVYGIDNLRYISSTGSTVLRVSGEDVYDGSDDGDFFDGGADVTDEDTFEPFDDGTADNPITKLKTKYKKIKLKTVVTDWLYAGIILGAEALLVAAGVAVFIILHGKKIKKRMARSAE